MMYCAVVARLVWFLLEKSDQTVEAIEPKPTPGRSSFEMFLETFFVSYGIDFGASRAGATPGLGVPYAIL